MAITVFRYADGETVIDNGMTTEYSCGDDPMVVYMPGSWQHRHRMLIDAAAEVKREAGVDHVPPAVDRVVCRGIFGGAYLCRWIGQPNELNNGRCPACLKSETLVFETAPGSREPNNRI